MITDRFDNDMLANAYKRVCESCSSRKYATKTHRIVKEAPEFHKGKAPGEEYVSPYGRAGKDYWGDRASSREDSSASANSRRVKYDEELDGDVRYAVEFYVPAKFFPRIVLNKYMQSTGFDEQEVNKEGVYFADVAFSGEPVYDSGEPYAHYKGPNVVYGQESSYLAGVNITSWRMPDKEYEDIFTVNDAAAQRRMDSAIQDALEQSVDGNLQEFDG